MRTQSPQEVKDYAKELYMKVGGNGEHQYSSRAICEMLQKKFPESKKFHHGTIGYWATGVNSNGQTWKAEYHAMIALGITAKDVEKSGLIFDDVMSNSIAKEIKEIAEINRKSNKAATNFIAVWQMIAQGELKKLAKTHGSFEKISIEAFNEKFSREDKALMFDIKKDTDKILERLRSATEGNPERASIEDINASIKETQERIRKLEIDIS